MRAQDFVTEVRSGLDQYVQQMFPTWPDYVIRDFVYKNIKNMSSQSDIQEWLDGVKRDYGQLKWSLQQLPITLDMFDPQSRQRIQARKGGSANPMQVPNDAQRHAQQQQIIKQQGVSKEPIIVVKTAQGYELLEGWHRTIQHLEAYPNGYKGPAWVGAA